MNHNPVTRGASLHRIKQFIPSDTTRHDTESRRNEIGELAIGVFVSHLSVVRKLTCPTMNQVKGTAEHVKLFEGENRSEKLSRLKSLIKPYTKPSTSDVYAPGKAALLSVDQNPGGGKSGGSAWVRMVLENSQWKVDWLVAAGQSVNLISNIDSYKTEEIKKEQ